MMKNKLFASASAIAVLLAAPAMANENTVNQDGSGNTATTDQTGGSEGVILIEQGTGFYGLASDSQAIVTQSEDGFGFPGFTTPTNDAEIYQAGDNLYAVINQANGNGFSDTNYGLIDQDGSSSGGVVAGTPFTQGAALSQDGEGNEGYILQGDGSVTRGGQAAEVEQVGDYNYADTYQDGNDSLLFVAQTGDDNEAIVEQSGVGPGGRRAVAVVIQTGNGNFSDSVQHARASELTVTQTGDDNESNILQRFSASRSTAYVEQVGNRNASDIDQGDSSTPTFDPNFADVTQTGDDNGALITQSGDDARNDASITQLTNGNTAEINQTGSRNTTIIFVSDALGASGDNNSTITQSGNRNMANVTQDGDLSDSMIIQSGNRNEATVLAQAGSGHTSLIDQSGNRNDALITQGLTDNDSSIFQTGLDGLVTVFQTVTTGNSSIVTQGGSLNVTLVSQ